MTQSPLYNTAIFKTHRAFDALMSESICEDGLEQPTIRMNLASCLFQNKEKMELDSPVVHVGRTSNTSLYKSPEQSQIAQRIAAEIKATNAELKLSSEKLHNKRARIEFEKDMDQLKSEKEHESSLVSKLRFEICQLAESVKLAKSDLSDALIELDQSQNAAEEKVLSLQRLYLGLKDDFQNAKEDCLQNTLDMNSKQSESKTELEVTVVKLEEARQALEMEKKRNQELTEKSMNRDVLTQSAEAINEKVKMLEDQIQQQNENACISRMMRDSIQKLPILEKQVKFLQDENDFLHSQQENVVLLQEQLRSAQRKLQAAEKKIDCLSQIQDEYENLKARRLNSETKENLGVCVRQSLQLSGLLHRVNELQASEVLSLDQREQLQSSMARLESQLSESRELTRILEVKLNAQAIDVDQQSTLLKQLKRKYQLVSKERDSFKRILDAYESDLTIQVNQSSHVEELQDVLAGFQTHTADMEAQLRSMSEQYKEASTRCFELEQKLQCEQYSGPSSALASYQDKLLNAQQEMLKLNDEISTLSKEKEVLEVRLQPGNAQADSVIARTNFIRLFDNSTGLEENQRETEVKRLTEENSLLMTQLQLLEQSKGDTAEDRTCQADLRMKAVPETNTIAELKAQLIKGEFRHKRLLEAFNTTSKAFRKACYQLLGYKIEIPCIGQYQLFNVYSESPDDYLLFKQGDSGEIQMLETDYSQLLEEKLNIYLQHRNCIPALLSSITLDLFKQQTMMV